MAAIVEPKLQDPPRTFWQILKSIGPGLIITANIVGTGELIVTTRLGSQFGFTLLWFVIFGCFIKVFVQIEWGRYTVSEGVTSLEALNRLPGPRAGVSWAVWLWTLMFVGTFFQLTGMMTTIAGMHSSPGTWAHRGLALLTASSVAVLLIAGRYGFIERASTFMVVGFTLLTVLGVALVQGTEWRMSGREVLSGLTFRIPEKDFLTAFSAFAITGVGAAELIFYPIWLLEKGYARYVGPRDDSPAWIERARAWMRVLRTDAWISMAIYTVATVAFYLLGAAILHRQNLVVGDKELVATLSGMYRSAFGGAGTAIFTVGAFVVLYSTLFVSTASDGRLFADLLSLFGVLRRGDDQLRRRTIHLGILGVLLFALGLYLLWGEAPVSLVTVGAVAQGIMLPFLGFAGLYFRHRVTHPALRPGAAWTVFLWISFFSLAAVGLFDAWKRLKPLWS